MSDVPPPLDELSSGNRDLQPTQRRGPLTTRVVSATLGALFVLAAVPLALFLWIDAISYGHWPSDGQFDGGQAPHEVTVGAGETFLLWKVSTFDTPDCLVTEIPSGDEVTLTDATSEGWDRGGGAVPYAAFAEGRSETARIAVSCAPTQKSSYDSGPDRYYVDSANGPPFLDGFGPWWPAPIALLVAGLGLLGLAAFTRPKRSQARATA